MKSNALHFRRLLRPALLLGAALGAAFGSLPGASAQTGPQPNSPAVPTPYQSPVFHSGGAEDPLQGTAAASLPLFEGREQGTPTAIVNVGGIPTPVQIPSYLLGAYDPTRPPGGVLGNPAAYYPEHFADGGVFQWIAPFDYIAQAAQNVTVDDTSTSFTQTGFTQITAGTIAGLATGGEYYRLPVGATGTATWTLTSVSSGSFSVYLHIPDNVQDLSRNPPVSESRSPAVTYSITTTTATGTRTTTATVSQTEANAQQLLAGPFSLLTGDTVTVTLSGNATNYDLVADSMTLQPTLGDVQSTPTAINRSAFPTDFLGFKYWGIYIPGQNGSPLNPTTTLTGQAAVTQNAPPDNTLGIAGNGLAGNGTPLFHYGDPAKVTDETGQPVTATSVARPIRLIRQVVYFGRSEPTAAYSTSADNSTQFTSVAGAASITDATATGGSYLRYNAAKAPGNVAGYWTLTAPASGSYFVSVHIPYNVVNAGRQAAPDIRISDASYVVSYTSGGTSVRVPVTLSQTSGGDYTLPIGSLPLLAGQAVSITLYSGTQSTQTNPVPAVVADSVTLTTGNQVGAIYCVDGSYGGVIWRFETPASLRGPSAPVFSAPAVKRVHVITGMATDPNTAAVTPIHQDKLVVIVGDNNGLVYCLDAVGNGDGTSNANVFDPATGQPIYLPQPLYGAAPPLQVDAQGYTPHVGTTQAYWIYRPDASLPKKLLQTFVTNPITGTQTPVPEEAPAGVAVGAVRRTPAPTGGIAGAAIHLYDRDLPIPSAFGSASPNVYVDPTITNIDQNNAVVYLPNSNGTLYALDALGVPFTTDPATGNETGGDRFNNSIDLSASEGAVPTPTTRWWFTLRGVAGASGTGDSAAAFTSAPALYSTAVTTPADPVAGTPATTAYQPSVYAGSSSEEGDSSNVGRLYALDGLAGPSGNGGRTPASLAAPGTPNYNLSQRPQTTATDTAHWSFPDAYGTDIYGTGKSSDKRPRPALGDVTGSPVVFTNYNGNFGESNITRRTRIYFAANSGLEIAPGSNDTVAAARPDDTTTGRVWAVNLDGSVGTTTSTNPVLGISTNTWVYPLANDPNQAKFDNLPEPQLPIGSFLNATPAIGFVQFPASITNGDGSPYLPRDAVRPLLQGARVPMLYVATRGAADTALYALDIDGDGTQGAPVAGVTTGKLVYRQPSPDGTIFQSSPVLVTNATLAGGNGGAVFVVGGNTLYDFSATPISNPFTAQTPPQNFPLIRQNKAFAGAGPISSPTLAAADVTDLNAPGVPTVYGGVNATDFVYFGDSSTGFCRGITPQDVTDGAIPTQYANAFPPVVDGIGEVDLSAIPQVYLVSNANASSTSAADGLATGSTAPLPVYEWGQNVYIRIKNVVPPLVSNGTQHYVVDTIASAAQAQGQAITAYGNGGAITFQLSDSAPGAVADTGTIPNVLLPAPAGANAGQPLANGFYIRSDTPAAKESASNLVDSTTPNQRYIAAYTYHIGDGSERLNTPGSQRRVLEVRQTVHIYTSSDGKNFTDTGRTMVLSGQVTNGNVVSQLNAAGTGYNQNLNQIPPVDQPTFGILNPLGVQGGGTPLPLGGTYNQAFQIGDALGPFRGVSPILPLTGGDSNDLQALANGNTIPTVVPPSTSGSGQSPITRPAGDLSTTAPNTHTSVVVTDTPLIPHNGSGDNTDPTPATVPPEGQYRAGSGLLSSNFGTVDQPYALDFFDRSALGLAGQTLQIRMTPTPNGGAGGGLAWVDNTGLTAPGNTTGHNSVVNYLPWETAPLGVRAGPNTSADYPNIPAGAVSATLYSAAGSSDLGAGRATPTPATAGTGTGTNYDPLLNRTVYGNPVQVHISVPNHQPANQQVYVDTGTVDKNGDPIYNAAGETTPNGLNTTQRAYPMGYYSQRRVFVPNINGQYRRGAAFRTVRVYTGVPVDMSTSIVSPTTDIGPVPSGLGIQTENFAPLGAFTPVVPFLQAGETLPPGGGLSPYTNYRDYFKPVTVQNDGNVNLLNVHFDQKQYYNGANHTLNLTSDTLDPLSFIPGYDMAGATGPRGNVMYPTVASPYIASTRIPEQPYLLRSSLDTDLIAAYGRNPALAANFGTIYPGATFHKALPGSDNPTTLTVPDSPDDTSTGYAMPKADQPQVNAGGAPQIAAPPLVSLAVPFGTPVGTYSQTVRAFEGLDTSGYQTYNTRSSAYNPLYPPQYGGAVGGIGTPGRSPDLVPSDVYQYGLQPVSTTGTVVKGSVLEDRMTDGYTFGALPQIDFGLVGTASNGNGGTTPQGVPDFGPAAFRDPQSGRISVYWTSSRNVPSNGSPYDIFGYNVNYNAPAFLAANRGQSWWSPIAGGGAMPGKIFDDASGNPTHSGLTIATDNSGTTYAFDVAVTNAPTYSNKLYAYPIANPATGAIGTGILLTADDSQVKYGIKGLIAGSTRYAFWTASTRGRTAIYYTPFSDKGATATPVVLPVPAGLTAVADPNPVFMPPTSGPNGAAVGNSIEVTFSGTAPDGSVDLYNCRYLADTTGALVLQSFAAVREIMAPVGGGYQARDAAWDRTGQLNLFAIDTATSNSPMPLLYDVNGKPQFTRAIVDKASGQLVLTGIPSPLGGTAKITAYIDGAAGRVRFVPALPPTFRIEGLFVPQAKRITGANADKRADTGPVSFLDSALKPNDSAGLTPVQADRRWYLWRKSSSGQAGAATLFYKTQRLTAYLPSPVDTTKPLTITLDGTAYTGPVDVLNIAGNSVPGSPGPSARLYFPISSGAEGKAITYSYTVAGTNGATYSGPPAGTTDTVQWQDERRNSDTSNPPVNATEGLQSAEGYAVPIATTVNENNVAAFLDPYAGTTVNGVVQPHKVWLFWNSTRNGTADLYMETIDPRFGP